MTGSRFAVTLEPTPYWQRSLVDGVEVPARIWRGKTAGGIAVQAAVMCLGPLDQKDHARLRDECSLYLQLTQSHQLAGNHPKVPATPPAPDRTSAERNDP